MCSRTASLRSPALIHVLVAAADRTAHAILVVPAQGRRTHRRLQGNPVGSSIRSPCDAAGKQPENRPLHVSATPWFGLRGFTTHLRTVPEAVVSAVHRRRYSWRAPWAVFKLPASLNHPEGTFSPKMQ